MVRTVFAQPRMQPRMSILPMWMSTGSVERMEPRGVRSCCGKEGRDRQQLNPHHHL